MFRKIVENLSFSPSLVGQLSAHIKAFRYEEKARQLGLLLAILLVSLQWFVVLRPTEQALGNSRSDIIPGGVTSVKQIQDYYEAGSKGQNDFKALLDYVSINISDLSSIQDNLVPICSDNQKIVMFGRQQNYSSNDGEGIHIVTKQDGDYSVFYSTPLHKFNQYNTISCYDSYVGFSSKVGWFGVAQASGNLLLAKELTLCPKDIVLISTSCNSSVTLHSKAVNLTRGNSEVHQTQANVSDRIEYSLSTTNISPNNISVPIEISLADILDYSRLIDAGNGSFNEQKATLGWYDVSIAPGQTDIKRFTIQVNEKIKATPKAANNPAAFNCVLTSTYGNTTEISLPCPLIKSLESTLNGLPRVGIASNLTFSVVILFLAGYFYARSYIIKKELQIIRKDYTGGL